MGRHLQEQRLRAQADPETVEVVRQVVPYMPAEILTRLDNLARARTAVIAFIAIMPLYLVMLVMTSTPEQFARAFLSPYFPMMVVLVAVMVAVLVRRAMTIGAIVVELMTQMAPEWAERIEATYGARGLGDVVAPWVKRRRGRIGGRVHSLLAKMLPPEMRR